MKLRMKHIGVFAILVMSSLGCSPPSLEINVTTNGTSVNLGKVSRYRVIVRQWCDAYPALAEDVSPASSIDVATAVVPGEDFYVWVQAWEACPDVPNVCPDPILAADDECRCVDTSPRYQKIIAEGCTPWLTLQDGQDSLDVALSQPTAACPPVRNEACP
jgi:hypothetical protein